uniref:Uncharacterized protein n=1 Tax=Glossina brevipalpis TaxID=37001 RepID=A0A1A9W2X0_9MUSC
MNALMFTLLYYCVMLIEPNCVFALKRIKRNSDVVNNLTKISDDFIILNPSTSNDDTKEKDNINIDTGAQKNGKELDNLYDKVMASFNFTKAKANERVKINGHNHGQNKMHKIAKKPIGSTLVGLGRMHSMVAPLSYVLRERERKLNERLMKENHNNYVASPESRAEVVIIDNSPKDLQKLNLVPKEISPMSDDLKHGNFIEDTEKNEIDDRIGTAAVTRNIVRAPNVVGENTFPAYHPFSMNSLPPAKQMFRFGNMLLYNGAKDTGPTPIHSQTAALSLMPANQPEAAADDSDTMDYYYNNVETPPSRSVIMTPPVAMPPVPAQNNDQTYSIICGPPFIFKQPIPANEPKKVLNLIENALDTLLEADDDDNDTEIELRCPIHHGKKSIADGNCIGDNLSTDGDENGVIQVCSCRFIKKKNDFEE